MTILVSAAPQTVLDSRRYSDGAGHSKPQAQRLQASKTNSLNKSRIVSAVISLAVPLAGICGEAKPVSYFHNVVPILKRSCTGCHHPAKLKGELDLTSYSSFQKGGKHGPSFKAETPAESRVIEEISGEEPNMPKEGDPLTKEEVALFERWIKEGAKDDTPPEANSFKLSAAPVYTVLPVISCMAFSPDGNVLAVSGYHEVVLHKNDGSEIIARLVGESPRIESVAFSANGNLVAISGGAPSRFGEIQFWDAESHKEVHAYKIANDSVFGVSFSPDGERLAFGCSDKTVRVISVNDGKELMKFDNHSDWVLATAFTVDGKRLLSGSRDRAMKLINVANGQFIDDINKLLESVLCMARHPKEDIVAFGGDLGTPRIYKISDNQGRTAANNDVNLVREFERQPGPVCSIAYSPDGNSIAVGNVNGEVRIYKTSDGSRMATLKENKGAVFALKFHPTKNQLVTGGYDGKVRIFEMPDGKLMTAFNPVPIKEGDKVAAVSGDSGK